MMTMASWLSDIEISIGNGFWDVATSAPVVGLLALVLLAALVVGYVPLAKYLPVVGPYVLPARLIALLVGFALAFLSGFRAADEREALARLRATLAIKEADLSIANRSAADAQAKVLRIEQAANEQRKADDDYIASLQARPACLLDDHDLRGLDGMRRSPAGDHRARSAAGP